MSLARLVITAVTVEQRSMSEVARDYGVSRVWVQKLVHRYEREGPAAFEPRSRRPHANPRAIASETEDQIVRLRKTLTRKRAGRRRGDDRRASAHGRGAGGAGDLDDLADSVPPRVRDPAAAETAPVVVEDVLRRPTQRTLAGRHHPLAAGRRIGGGDLEHPRRPFPRQHRRPRPPDHPRHPGRRHLHRRVHPMGEAGQRAHRQRVFTGKQRGEGRVALEVELGLRGIRLSHSRPYHPQTCGKVERFHQTQKKWLAAQPPATTIAMLQHQLDRFQTYYNTIRPHRALNRHTPAQAYAARPKAVPTGPVIPAHYRVRHDKIDTGGSITLVTTPGCTTSASAPASPAPPSAC
jgi:transposase InsO family protein